MASQLALDLAATLDRRRLLGGMAMGLSGAALTACGSRAGAQDASAGCLASPTEIKGPFPADGSNGRPRAINVLAMEGVVRRDIRASFAGMHGSADGVPLELTLALIGPGCRPLPEGAIYLWQNDAAGDYSLYSLRDANYLRGLQQADSTGRLSFTTIVPGCYGGRYPHCHFEVFESLTAAIGGRAPLLVSQLAFPESACRAIYDGDARYGGSLQNLERLPIERDFVFGDTGAAGQIVSMRSHGAGGYTGTATITLSA
jgi:protocatechuate 3,4-dioxygenase beta subunit